MLVREKPSSTNATVPDCPLPLAYARGRFLLVHPELRPSLFAHLAFIPGWVKGYFHFRIMHAWKSAEFTGCGINEVLQQRAPWRGERHEHVNILLWGNGNFIDKPQLNNINPEFGIITSFERVEYLCFSDHRNSVGVRVQDYKRTTPPFW